jgi:hypothetical protein
MEFPRPRTTRILLRSDCLHTKYILSFPDTVARSLTLDCIVLTSSVLLLHERWHTPLSRMHLAEGRRCYDTLTLNFVRSENLANTSVQRINASRIASWSLFQLAIRLCSRWITSTSVTSDVVDTQPCTSADGLLQRLEPQLHVCCASETEALGYSIQKFSICFEYS